MIHLGQIMALHYRFIQKRDLTPCVYIHSVPNRKKNQ